MQKNSFVIKICVLTDIKQNKQKIYIYIIQIYYKVDKNKGSIFFKQFTMLRNGLNRAYCSVSARLKCQFLYSLVYLYFVPRVKFGTLA